MQIDRYDRVSWVALLLPLALILGCDDDESNSQGPDDVEMVLVQGVVIDIDRARIPEHARAEGVRVVLVGDERIMSTQPTGSDGVFTMRVPKGTLFQTVTDDFDPADDDWYPMINADYPGLVIDGPRSDLLIHACPNADTFPKDENDHEAGSGGLASFNAYLTDCIDPDYPDFGIPSVEDANGAIVFLAPESISGSCGWTPGVSTMLDHEAFTVGYLDANKKWFTPERETCYTQPTSATGTDASGVAFAFAGPALRTESVTLLVEDTNLARGLEYVPFDVPVRFGALTLVFAGRIDDQGGKHVVECLCDCGGAPDGIDCE